MRFEEEAVNPRCTLLAATMAALLAAAVPSALGQLFQPVGASRPSDVTSGVKGPALIPDLSGTWARLSFPGFEPPLSGPGPVTNRLRAPNGASSLFALVGDYTNPILKPRAAEAVKKHGEIELRGAHAPNPRTQCWPGGVPFAFTNVGMQMIQQPDRITILYADQYQVRRVRLNEPHPAQVTPSWYGDSVGHYESDTLVIDTVGIKIGPFAMVDWYGTPFTEALHVVERYRLLDYEAAKAAQERGEKENIGVPQADQGFARDLNYRGKGLQLHFIVEDNNVFTTPWSATVTYRRPLSIFGQWPEYICAQNAAGYDRGERAAVPTADKPDF
jgi:hypothetical protein